MGHEHAGAGGRHRGRLTFVFALTAAYTVVQFFGAWLTGSLALLADAAHMLTDVGGLGLALLAIRLAMRPASPAMSFGYYRTEILAALVNGAILFAVGGYVLYEAIERFQDPPEVAGWRMIAIASVGLLVNVVGALILRGGSQQSLNVEGAFLEVVADLLGSIGVIAAGIIIVTTGWSYADPVFSVGIGLFIIPRTLRLMRGAVSVLMEGAPGGLDVAAVATAIADDPAVRDVHDLHVWSITSGVPALSAHVVVQPGASGDDVLTRINDRLAKRFAIHHTTLQIEHARRVERSYHDSL